MSEKPRASELAMPDIFDHVVTLRLGDRKHPPHDDPAVDCPLGSLIEVCEVCGPFGCRPPLPGLPGQFELPAAEEWVSVAHQLQVCSGLSVTEYRKQKSADERVDDILMVLRG